MTSGLSRLSVTDSDVVDLVRRSVRADRRALARLLSVLEDGTLQHRGLVLSTAHRAVETSNLAQPRIIGITGPPGVGKSTLTAAMCGLLRAEGRQVAVLAVDPSSPFSGGAVLGDSIRMQQLRGDPGVYIRSMAARNHLGGLSAIAHQALLIISSSGFDDIIVETVGVGQSEVEIIRMADTVIDVLSPGMGDWVQATKAGLLEIGDVFAVNKADQDGSKKLISELRAMLSNQPRFSTLKKQVISVVATRSEGVAELLRAVDEHGRWQTECGNGEVRRPNPWRQHFRDVSFCKTCGAYIDTLGDRDTF